MNTIRKALSSAIGGVLAVLIIGALVIGLVVFNGWVLECLWSWFVVPLGVRALPLWAACGISLVVRFLTYDSQTFKIKDDKDEESTLQSLASVAAPAFYLAIGFIFHWLAS